MTTATPPINKTRSQCTHTHKEEGEKGASPQPVAPSGAAPPGLPTAPSPACGGCPVSARWVVCTHAS